MAEDANEYQVGCMYYVTPDKLVPSPELVRTAIDTARLTLLKNSILMMGMISPLLVQPRPDGTFLIVDGYQRYLAGPTVLPQLPVVIVEGDPFEIWMSANTVRENLSAIEMAEGLARLKAEKGYTLQILERIVGLASSSISEILSLAKLPDEVKDDCRANRETHWSVLARIAREPSEKKMAALYKKWKEQGLKRWEVDQEGSVTKAPRPFDSKVTGWTKMLAKYAPAKVEPSVRPKALEALLKHKEAVEALIEAYRNDPPPAESVPASEPAAASFGAAGVAGASSPAVPAMANLEPAPSGGRVPVATAPRGKRHGPPSRPGDGRGHPATVRAPSPPQPSSIPIAGSSRFSAGRNSIHGSQRHHDQRSCIEQGNRIEQPKAPSCLCYPAMVW